MKLPEELRAKVDAKLAERLESDVGMHRVRVVAKLREPESAGASPELDPADFGSRTAFRRALIAFKQDEVDAADKAFRAKLEKLKVSVRGAGLLRSVVLEGNAEQIARALEDDLVETAVADFEIDYDLEQPWFDN